LPAVLTFINAHIQLGILRLLKAAFGQAWRTLTRFHSRLIVRSGL